MQRTYLNNTSLKHTFFMICNYEAKLNIFVYLAIKYIQIEIISDIIYSINI